MNRQQRRAAARQGAPQAAPGPAVVPGIADMFAAGVAHHQGGRLPQAEACYRQVLTIQPDHADTLHLLGVIAYQVGRHDVAIDLIRRAIARNGKNPAYFCNLGDALRDFGSFEEAASACCEAIRLKPDFAEAHSNLGLALKGQGKLDEAIAACREAVRLNPALAEAHFNLGNALRAQERYDEAVAASRRAVSVNPRSAKAHCNLGAALCDQGHYEEAIAACREAIRLKPDLVEAYSALGTTLRQTGHFDHAVAAFREAVRIKPDDAGAHCNLGLALRDLNGVDEAVAAIRESIRIKPDLGAYGCLASALCDQGELEDAVETYHRAVGSKMEFAESTSSCFLFCLNYSETISSAALFEAHCAWDERHGRPTPPRDAYANDRSPGRRLKVGYVSPDFRQHSVAYFLEPLLRGHDRDEVEAFCYAEVSAPDAGTQRFKGLANRWVATVGLSDAALAERIRSDGIDILVDLAGHTAKNRLAAFARKPAPVQVNWLGYPNTTGLKAMDYRLVDAVTDPEGEADAYASEALVRLPDGFLCYSARDEAPARGAAPCLSNGFVTFGSFNSPAKLSGATLDAWAQVLTRLPTARLLLKGKPFADAATRARYLGRLAERGVAADRVELVGWLPDSKGHLALYDRIDVALDPFPYNGTTTTCEALWMGVPVVTLRGDRHSGRVGASLLTRVGSTDLIANSVEAYVTTAVALAGDPARLADLRRSLRPRMAASSLCDAAGFARKVEDAYRTMWARWCAAPATAVGVTR
jgi:protein O-GlcNAc transferase